MFKKKRLMEYEQTVIDIIDQCSKISTYDINCRSSK